MPKKILFISDLHKRDVDFTSITGYVEANVQIQLDILQFIENNNIDIVVIGGDWYDRGYRHTGPTLSDNELDRRLSASVNGNVYLTLGNHYYLERDNNPESYVIQPCAAHPTLHKIIAPKVPIFKCVDNIVVNGVQISFFHFDKQNKNYHMKLEDGVKFHIGVYHDDCVVPTDVRERAGYYGSTSSTYLNGIYDNVNFAIVNHIHTAIGSYKLHLNNGRNMTMFIPGSLGITCNKEIEKHKSVQLPVVTISDDGDVSCTLHNFLTHIDMLKFYNKKEASGNVAANITEITKAHCDINMDIPKSRTLVEYLKNKGYPESYISVALKAANTELDITDVYNTIKERDDNLNDARRIIE